MRSLYSIFIAINPSFVLVNRQILQHEGTRQNIILLLTEHNLYAINKFINMILYTTNQENLA